MDERKTRECLLPPQQLAPTKSVASTEVRRNSDVDQRLTHKFEVSRSKFEPKPSRYMLEVLKRAQEASGSPHTKMSSSILDSSNRAKNTLLDSYEIERILRQLDYYIGSSHAKYNECDSDGQRPGVVEGRNNKVVPKKNIPKWLSLKHGMMCSSARNDVVESKSFGNSSRVKSSVSMGMEVVGYRPEPSLVA